MGEGRVGGGDAEEREEVLRKRREVRRLGRLQGIRPELPQGLGVERDVKISDDDFEVSGEHP